MITLKKNTIALFYPDPGGEYICPPYPLLYLEKELRNKGYDVLLVDERFDGKAEDIIESCKDTLLAVGFSVILGYQVVRAVEASKNIRKQLPELPIVWGGAFVNWTPLTCLNENYIDYILTGQAEYSLPLLLQWLSGDITVPLENIPGLGYHVNGQPVHNKRGIYQSPFEKLPIRYDLLKLSNYVENGSLHYIASVGCTHYCNFCFVSQTWKGRCFSNSATQIINDFDYFLKTCPDIRYIALDDTNFFTHRDTVLALCRSLKERQIKMNWCGTTRIKEFLDLYTDDDLRLLHEAGCDTIYAGGESGDETVLRQLNKRQTVADIITFNRRVSASGIKPSLSFMILFPGQPRVDLVKTLKLIMKLKLDAPAMVFTMNAYIPMRKNTYYYTALEQHYAFPRDMEGITEGIQTGFTMPWHKTRDFNMLDDFSEFYFRFSNPVYYKEAPLRNRAFMRFVNTIAYPFIRLRFKTRRTGFRYEAFLYKGLLKIYGIFAPLPETTDQKRYMTPRAKNF